MRARWKFLGGTGLVGLGVALIVVGRSALSHGDTTTPSSAASADPNNHDPSEPYDLGPDAIAYDQLDPVGKAGVDSILQNEQLSQPPSSYSAWADVAATAAADAQAQIAARQVGLVGTEQDGVSP